MKTNVEKRRAAQGKRTRAASKKIQSDKEYNKSKGRNSTAAGKDTKNQDKARVKRTKSHMSDMKKAQRADASTKRKAKVASKAAKIAKTARGGAAGAALAVGSALGKKRTEKARKAEFKEGLSGKGATKRHTKAANAASDKYFPKKRAPKASPTMSKAIKARGKKGAKK